MTDTFEDVKIAEADGGMFTIDRGGGRTSLRPDHARKICGAIEQMTHDFIVRVIAVTRAEKHFSTVGGFTFAQRLETVFVVDTRAQICSAFQEGARLGIIIARMADGAYKFLAGMPDPAIRIERANSIGSSTLGSHLIVMMANCPVSALQMLRQSGEGLKYAQLPRAPARRAHCKRCHGACVHAREIAATYACKRVRQTFVASRGRQIHAVEKQYRPKVSGADNRFGRRHVR